MAPELPNQLNELARGRLGMNCACAGGSKSIARAPWRRLISMRRWPGGAGATETRDPEPLNRLNPRLGATESTERATGATGQSNGLARAPRNQLARAPRRSNRYAGGPEWPEPLNPLNRRPGATGQSNGLARAARNQLARAPRKSNRCARDPEGPEPLNSRPGATDSAHAASK